MGKTCRHLPHLAHPSHVRDVGLQLLEPPLGLLTLCQVANKADEQAVCAEPHFANGKLYRKDASVLALTHDNAPGSDDPPLAGPQVSLDVEIMHFPMGPHTSAAEKPNIRSAVVLKD
jgi:hypothetical protein